jgi:hypothetical protein
MPRPHEDIERHTPVDHRPGGLPITFAPGAWCAIEVAHMASDRVDAGISSYETLIEQARTSGAKARTAAVLRSANDRRVVALVELDGHEGFRHLRSTWDYRHLEAGHHRVAESDSLALYQVSASEGETNIDPDSKHAYAFERLARKPQSVRKIVTAIANAPGARGALVFGSDDGNSSAILYRFERSAEIDAFRASAAAIDILGPVGAEGESLSNVHAVKTFA